MSDILIAILVLVFLAILVLIPNIKILSPNSVMIIERLGFFHRIVTKPGVHILIPLFERVPQVVCLDPVHKKLTIKEISEEIVIPFTYKVKNPKLFVYAALDSEKELMVHMKNAYLIDRENPRKFEEDAIEYAIQLGIELISIDI
jgi:regulator of protease activity HflC (stomatin/prohibitin superfamily)